MPRASLTCRPRRPLVLQSLIGLVLAGFAVAMPMSVEARMYQWVDPVRGSAQLSGTPPAWYRGEADGPRVRVFDNGNLIDDTAITLPRARARELREAAFAEYQQRQQSEALRQLERAALKERRRREEAERLAEQRAVAARAPERGSDEPAEPATSRVLAVPEDPEAITAETVERLKALLGEFDRQGGDLRR